MKLKSTFLSLKNFLSSGFILGIVFGAVTVFGIQQINFANKLAASALPGSLPPICGLTEMPASNSTSGIISTEQEYNSAVISYQQAHPNNLPSLTWGGMIGKNQLIAIINSLGTAATEVNYKFITNSGDNKTSLYFKGGTFNAVTGDPGSSQLYIRTGSTGAAFCPPTCN